MLTAGFWILSDYGDGGAPQVLLLAELPRDLSANASDGRSHYEDAPTVTQNDLNRR